MKKVILLFALTMTMVFQSCNDATTTEEREVTPVAALEMAKNGVLFVDVRTKEEVAETSYDVKNYINIPLDELEQSLNKLPKDKQLVLVCKSGNRSGQAYDILKEKGYTSISTMAGGMNEWSKLKLPVVNGKACCADPTSSNCNPDGTCKPQTEKACCDEKAMDKCNEDGSCKNGAKCTEEEKAACKSSDKACCTPAKK